MAKATCKIDHNNDPEGIPAFLCRACHPEMVMTRERRRELDAADIAQQRKASRMLAIAREAERCRRRADKLDMSNSHISANIGARLRKKVARLEAELAELSGTQPTTKG